MRITCSYHSTKRVWETSESEVVFGRAEEQDLVALDLSPDPRVSRIHGRIWEEDGSLWIEDLDSSRGTLLNGASIKGRSKQALRPGDSVLVGETLLRVESDEKPERRRTTYVEHGALLLPEPRHTESRMVVDKDVDATSINSLLVLAEESVAARRLRMACDLPFQFANKTTLESLLPAIVDQLVAVIPSIESWVMLLRDYDTDRLSPRAFHYLRRPYLSETLLRRAMTERKAFVWRRDPRPSSSRPVTQESVEAGVYVPLLWQGDVLGTICAAKRTPQAAAFSDEDVGLLVLVSQFVAMSLATYRLQDKLRRESVIKANLLRQFSPKVASQLLAYRGALRLGGRRGEVTMLNSDIRGFSQLAREMDSEEVIQMLNEYLGVLVPVIFAHNGTIDKFIGDAILAVFGSPGVDPQHHENAVRAAVEMQIAVSKLNEARRFRGAPCCDFGIGIHCGEVVHGFVGTADRMEFTVVGDAVNLTQRYCAAAGGQEVLISPEEYEHVGHLLETVQAIVHTKHEGDFLAYRIVYLKESNETIAVRFTDGQQ
jgi:adenylate cyclase